MDTRYPNATLCHSLKPSQWSRSLELPLLCLQGFPNFSHLPFEPPWCNAQGCPGPPACDAEAAGLCVPGSSLVWPGPTQPGSKACVPLLGSAACILPLFWEGLSWAVGRSCRRAAQQTGNLFPNCWSHRGKRGWLASGHTTPSCSPPQPSGQVTRETPRGSLTSTSALSQGGSRKIKGTPISGALPCAGPPVVATFHPCPVESSQQEPTSVSVASLG